MRQMEAGAQLEAGDGQVLRATQALQGGGVVGYPSETVWGLAALPVPRAAVDRLYLLKGREADKPVQLSCLTQGVARRWVRPGQRGFGALAGFWPGPLTLLAWAAEDCPDWLAPGGVVGLRVPAHPTIQALLERCGGTLATTSLNPSGLPAASSAAQARAYGLADFLLTDDSGEPAGVQTGSVGLASTVFDLRTRRVLRRGAVTEAELLEALP
ncbi:L-threonylcarbamoyladenylate synthase [Deinococcus sp.]|uniref:L-threonylcarbamoyladenylate synthase n=1 Tax=Deinococcus sp. TaxID=47478 RepID=UPI003C7D57A4